GLLFVLRNPDFQDSVVVLGVDLFAIRVFRKGERTGELAVLGFDRVHTVVLAFTLHLSFAAYGQNIVVHVHLKVFLVHTGHGYLHIIARFIFKNIHARYEREGGPTVANDRIIEEAVNQRTESRRSKVTPDRIISNEAHSVLFFGSTSKSPSTLIGKSMPHP